MLESSKRDLELLGDNQLMRTVGQLAGLHAEVLSFLENNIKSDLRIRNGFTFPMFFKSSISLKDIFLKIALNQDNLFSA